MTDAISLDDKEIVVIPAVPEQVAYLMWISQILIRTPDPQCIKEGTGEVAIEYYPMTKDGIVLRHDSTGRSLMRVIRTYNLYADMEAIPELEAAFSAFLAAIVPFQQVQRASVEEIK